MDSFTSGLVPPQNMSLPMYFHQTNFRNYWTSEARVCIYLYKHQSHRFSLYFKRNHVFVAGGDGRHNL